MAARIPIMTRLASFLGVADAGKQQKHQGKYKNRKIKIYDTL